MAVEHANGTTMVPAKYRANRFVMAAWYAINTVWVTKGKWINYKDFQRIAQGPDRQCRESVFDDTLASCKLDETLNPRKVHEVNPDAPDPKIPQPHELYQKEATSPIADAIAKGIDKAAKSYQAPAKPPREPVTADRRKQAEDWIVANLDAGWVPFKQNFAEPEFDSSWWNKTRNGFLHPAPIQKENSNLSATLTFDPRTTTETRQATKWLLTLSGPDRINALSYKDYVDKTRHKLEYHQFRKAQQLALKFLKEGGKLKNSSVGAVETTKPAAAPVEEKAAPKVPRGPKPHGMTPAMMRQFAHLKVPLCQPIPLDQFQCEPKLLKELALTIARALLPETEGIEAVILSDPKALELRGPIQF